MILDPYDDYLDDHHPACRGDCGQLADECMCNWIKFDLLHPAPKSARVEATDND